ncbi:MAG: hypothetical protein J5518_00595 [Lachnospiraceae bacterium]|nr:hypothetical protein [Lachnospiraceae bacterium]
MSKRNRKKNQNQEVFEDARMQNVLEPIEQDPVWRDIEDREARQGLRVFAVVMALIVTLLIAIVSGIGLALIDLEKKPHDLIQAINGKDIDEAVTAAKEEYEAIYAAAESKITVDIQYDETENNGSADANAEDTPDGDDPAGQEGMVANASEEIAGIGEVINAGTNDIIVYKPSDDTGTRPTTTVINDPDANYPLPFSTVDLSYFDDALFIGDSRMLGFGMYSGLTNATFYAVTSFTIFRYETMPVVQTPTGKVPIFDALPYDQFTKIYIKVGLNELGGSDSSFIKVYDEFVTRLRQMEPRAIIYTHAILPVTAAKSETDHTHSNENINARNEALRQYAEEHKCYYIDIKPVVSLPDGSLMPEMAGDGIHLKAGYMELWKEYLRTHAVIF